MRRYAYLLAAAMAALGCTGGDAPAKDAKKGPGALDANAKALKAEIEKNLGIVQRALEKDPLNVERTVADCEKYAAQARESGFADVAQRADTLKAQAKETFETAAEREVVEALETSRKYIAAGDLKKARNRLVGLHKNLQKDARFWDRALAGLKDIERAERADRYYEKVTKAKLDQFKTQGEWERAQGLLEAFLVMPAFRTSPRAKEIEAALAQVKPEAEKVKALRTSESALKPVPAFRGRAEDLYEWDMADSEACNVVNEVLVFKHSVDDSEFLTMSFGSDDWEDYILDFSMRMVKGPMYIYFRGFRPSEDAQRSWEHSVKLEQSDCPDKEKWYKVRLDIRGNKMTWTRPGSVAPGVITLKQPKGPFLFRIPKGAEVQFKSIWVKVLKPAKSS